MSNVYVDDTLLTNLANMFRKQVNSSDKMTLDDITTLMGNNCIRFGSVSSTDRNKDYTIDTGLKSLNQFVIAKYSGNNELGLFSYSYRPPSQGGYSNNGDGNGMVRYNDMYSFSNGIVTISGSNSRGLLGTYRWIAIGVAKD